MRQDRLPGPLPSLRVRLLQPRIKRYVLDVLFWARRFYWRWRAPITLGVQAIILSQHRILLVRHDYGDRWIWRLPGGAVKRKETLIDALRREVTEEINAEIQIERLHGVYYNFKRGASDHIIVFIASLKNPTALKPSWEIRDIGLFELDALPKSTSPATRRRIEEYLRQANGTEYRPW
ncbi:MAG: NUDIX domain-containing protein [Acidobacteria bacterium]|nr:NUDIX domain-containing protein [Acidobacteriota bacterium]